MVRKTKKKSKVGVNTQEAIDDICENPVTGSFGGKAVIVTNFFDAVKALADTGLEALSPTLISKIAWGVIKDGYVTVPEIEDEYEPWTKKELRALSDKELKAEGKEFEVKVPKKLTKKSKKKLIDDILEAQEEEDDDDYDEDEEEEADLYTKTELKGMDKDELLEIADEWELDVTKETKGNLIKAILEFQEEELE